jgi:PAS domain S-box-containing protein
MESNERFRNLADDSPMFVFIIDPDPLAPVSYWNKAWLSYTGQTYEEAVGRAWNGIIHPDDVPIVMDYYVPAFQNQQPYFIPAVRVKKHDGTYRWHLFQGNPRYLANGQFNGYVGVGFDVHEQKIATEAVKESEARAKAAIEIARLGTFEINVQAQTIFHSPRNAEILGLDPTKQWPYQKIIETVHPEDREIRGKALEQAKQTGVLFYEARVIHPDQSIHWVRLNGRYIKQDNQPTIIGTLMDITEEKRAAEVLEQKVEERTRELKQVNEQLKQFTYAASHDLQEPLRKISFFLDRLLSNIGPSLNEDNQRITERIQHTALRMRNLIDDLLAYSNTSLGVTGFETVDLNVTVQDVLDDMEATIIEKSAVVDVQSLPTVTGDGRQLRQLFQNIISNALKYNKRGEPPLLSITCNSIQGGDTDAILPEERSGEQFYLIEIKDNGIGFDPDDAERIFRLFQRLHGKAEYEGTGVGLAIVQQVADNHKGFVWAESSAGEGSIFKLLLPVEQA